MTIDSPEFAHLLDELARRTSELEQDGSWPGEQLQLLGSAGVLGWLIPREFGGSGWSSADVTEGYLALSQACLVTCFVLTQRNAAIQRVVVSENQAARERFLPPLSTADAFATVGISHLTTSRQHLAKPSVTVTASGDGYELNGFVPWTTGAAAADWILTGGTLSDGRQILAMVRTADDGVDIKPPVPLLALNASQTGAVELTGVRVSAEQVIAGPVNAVMRQGSNSGTGSLTTSALALGAAAGSVEQIRQEAESRADLVEIHRQLAAELDSIVADMRRAMSSTADPADPALSAESIRQRANSFVLRSSQAYLAASKGAGFAKGHPAERAIREAMFFLVWSCPQPVLNANLRELACLAGA